MWPFPQPGPGQSRSARRKRLFELHRQAQVQAMCAETAPPLLAEVENQVQQRAIASLRPVLSRRAAKPRRHDEFLGTVGA